MMLERSRILWDRSPSLTMKKIIDWAKEGLERAARVWHRRFMPGHFTVEGARKYGYQPRSGELGPGGVPMEPPRVPKHGRDRHGNTYVSTVQNPKYAWRKRRKMRHGRPLVWSGRSETAAKAAVKVSSRRSGGELKGIAAMPLLPKYFYQYLKAGTYTSGLGERSNQFTLAHDQPKKFEELVRTTDDEISFLTDIVQRHVEHQLATPPVGRAQTIAA